MDDLNKEEKEIYEVDNKKFTVISRVSNNNFNKDKLVRLIANYAMQELRQEDF